MAKKPKSATESAEKRSADIKAGLYFTTGALHFALDLFGDDIAKREGYRSNNGMDAVRFYLMNKHGWLPRDVLTMSFEEMRFALSEEMHGWVMPVAARSSYPEMSPAVWERGL